MEFYFSPRNHILTDKSYLGEDIGKEYSRQMKYFQRSWVKTGHDTLKELIESLWIGVVKSVRTVVRNKSLRGQSGQNYVKLVGLCSVLDTEGEGGGSIKHDVSTWQGWWSRSLEEDRVLVEMILEFGFELVTVSMKQPGIYFVLWGTSPQIVFFCGSFILSQSCTYTIS